MYTARKDGHATYYPTPNGIDLRTEKQVFFDQENKEYVVDLLRLYIRSQEKRNSSIFKSPLKNEDPSPRPSISFEKKTMNKLENSRNSYFIIFMLA